MSGEYRKAKNSPVIIWIIKHNPNNEPKFHMIEIFNGVGTFIKFLIIINWKFFINFIKI